VPAERIAQNLAFINWTLLTGLAIGSFAAAVLARQRTDATRGFLAFTAACAVVAGLLAWLSDQALPASMTGSPIRVDPAFDLPRRLALTAFIALAAVWVVAVARRRRATRDAATSAQNRRSATWRGPSHAGSTTTGESASVLGSAPSEITARTPNPRAHKVVNRR
jgi:hypothetical protein